jgi:His/Glu/Gln/Arg/opine family amino acid ABC transporter permease subunit
MLNFPFDFTPILPHFPALWHGLILTVQAALIIAALGILIGMVGAAAKLSRFRVLQVGARIYTHIFRGLPEIVIVLASYFGASALITTFFPSSTFELAPFWAGCIALALTFGAYATEIFRAAYAAIPRGEIEAAIAFGMTSSMRFFRLIMPQALRYALAGLGNLFLVILKETSLLSVIGVAELMRQTKVAINYTSLPFTFYFVAALCYLLMTGLMMVLLRAVEKRATRGLDITRGQHA